VYFEDKSTHNLIFAVESCPVVPTRASLMPTRE
jgi:hypothetical protein